MNNLLQDLRYGARMLLKQPGFTLIAVITLALGVGANTAIFSLLDQVMLRRLPVERPDELVVLRAPGPIRGHAWSDGDIATSFSYPMYKNLREKNEVFTGLLARYAIPLSVSTRGQTERASGELVSGNYFETLGVRPALGRVFSQADEQLAGAHPVAALSYGYWSRRFGLDPTILNQTLLVNGQSLTVVGVTRAGFNGVQVGQTPDIFIPLMMKAQMTPNWDGLKDWNDYWLAIIGRLKPGVTREQAEARLALTFRPLLEEQLPMIQGWSQDVRERFLAKRILLAPGSRGRTILQDDTRAPLWALFGLALLVLLIACTNVANLLLARGLGRQRELAIRLALGAGRWKLARQLLLESLLLSLLGGAFGLLIAAWVGDGLIRAMSAGAGAEGLSAGLDARVLGFTFALSVVTGIVFGLIPALRATRGDITPALKDQSSNASASQSQSRLRKSLVTAQVALTMLLLVVAGLFARTLWNLRHTNLGIKAEQMITFSLAPELNGYSPAKVAAFCDQLHDALAAQPGVQGVAISTTAILTDNSEGSNITVEGADQSAGVDRRVNGNRVSPGYFGVMGIPLLAGREFTRAETSTSPKVAIINETAAKRFFPNRSPVGARFAFGRGSAKPDIEIVGVVKDIRYANVREESVAFVYQPYTQDKSLGQITFYVRAQQDVSGVVHALRQEEQRLDANLPVFDLKMMEEVIASNLFGERMMAFLSVCFGALAALLAGLGLYGMLAYWVVQRRREIGIRVALGATPRDVRSLVIRQGLTVALIGTGIGLASSLALTRLMTGMLYGVGAADLLTFVIIPALLALFALLACWIPARRAAKVDPMVALLGE
jgi:predicted permease